MCEPCWTLGAAMALEVRSAKLRRDWEYFILGDLNEGLGNYIDG